MYQYRHLSTIQTSWVPKCEWQWKLPSLGHLDSKLKWKEDGVLVVPAGWGDVMRCLLTALWHRMAPKYTYTQHCVHVQNTLCSSLWHRMAPKYTYPPHCACAKKIAFWFIIATVPQQQYSFTQNCAQYALHEHMCSVLWHISNATLHWTLDKCTFIFSTSKCSLCTDDTKRNHMVESTLCFCLFRLIYVW